MNNYESKKHQNRTGFQVELENTVKSFAPIGDNKLWEHLIEILSSGKKLRSGFVSSLWKNCLPKQEMPKQLINDLIALELIHTSTLIHDDIIDKGQFRRNISTINNEFGDEIALLTGNLVKDLALKLSTPQNVYILNASSYDVNLGQLWETLARRHETIGINHYFAILLFKTSKIFIHALDIFYTFSQIALTDTEKNFVVAMAMLYQIADDLFDNLNADQKDKSIGQDKKNNVHSFIYTSFDDELNNLACDDGVQFTEEVCFIRKYIDIARSSYNFKSKIEELPDKKQLDFLKDLCRLLTLDIKEQKINDEISKVLSIYLEKILNSVSNLQLE
jgi:heptaprenyl diphosphate synthase